MPDGRLHLISAITPQKSVSTSSSTSVSQTLPASSLRPAAAPRTLLIGGQRFLVSSTAGAQVLLAPGSVGGQKIISGLSGSGLSRPQLMLTSPSQSTILRMPSGQHVVVRPSQPAAAVSASQCSSLSTAQGLLSAAGKSPPSSPYAVTPEVVQHGK